MIFWIKINLSSIRWEFWTASAEQQTPQRCNIDVRSFHNMKNQRWSVVGRPVSVPLCACSHVFVLLWECLVFHQHAWALLVVHAASRTHHGWGNNGPVSHPSIQTHRFKLLFISSLISVSITKLLLIPIKIRVYIMFKLQKYRVSHFIRYTSSPDCTSVQLGI